MKALILAAGYGTRLLPHTKKIPKPLFTINNIPVLEHTVKQLVTAGCDHILINTHHLHESISAFIEHLHCPVTVQLLFEPVILDTGGAIANAKSFLKNSPFFVINADVVSSIDLKQVYSFHTQSNCLATLVLHDDKTFNKVSVDAKGFIQNFNTPEKGLAFTGIQVLSPEIYDYFPDEHIFSSIGVYQSLCPQKQVKAFVDKDMFWSDIGTPSSYAMTSLCHLAASRFGITQDRIKQIKIDTLAGDGSDRKWIRASYQNKSQVIANHGICLPGSDDLLQLNAFIHIGNHLLSKGLNVPCIQAYDVLSGMVLLEDLGDVHLETCIQQKNNDAFTINLYQQVIDELINFSIKGGQGFEKKWACQTETYSKELILEKECRYFINAFIRDYLNRDSLFDDFLPEFEYIADQALANGFSGLMHRDMQSRNIMIHNGHPYFIDFQSARIGPLQYDLASLLIDPYVSLKEDIKNTLVQYTMEKLNLSQEQRKYFFMSYQYCCLTRNLQILGAFGFLTQRKMKPGFERHIPNAVRSLKKIVSGLNTDTLFNLSTLVHTL